MGAELSLCLVMHTPYVAFYRPLTAPTGELWPTASFSGCNFSPLTIEMLRKLIFFSSLKLRQTERSIRQKEIHK